MDKKSSLAALAALAHDTRVEIVRTLVRAGSDGLCAGEVATEVGGRQNTVSNHLAILARAGLVRYRREGRCVRYFADLDGMEGLVAFLTEDCCDGAAGNRADVA